MFCHRSIEKSNPGQAELNWTSPKNCWRLLSPLASGCVNIFPTVFESDRSLFLPTAVSQSVSLSEEVNFYYFCPWESDDLFFSSPWEDREDVYFNTNAATQKYRKKYWGQWQREAALINNFVIGGFALLFGLNIPLKRREKKPPLVCLVIRRKLFFSYLLFSEEKFSGRRSCPTCLSLNMKESFLA